MTQDTNYKVSNPEYDTLISKSLENSSAKEKSIALGKIVSIENDIVTIDVGLKSEGRVPLNEFNRPGQSSEIQVGDEIEVFIENVDNANGETLLSREKAVKQKAWHNLQLSFNENKVVTGVPFNRVKGGMSVDLNGVVAFLPGSQIETRQIIKDTKELLNKPLELMILKMDKYRGNIVVSRKAITENELKEQRSELLKNIKEGSIIEGKVKNITDYGAFIDLGGLDGLLHITDISWSRVTNPSDHLNIGEEIDVKVLSFDKEKLRVSLGLKQIHNDPWENVESNYSVGGVYEAEVSNITDYGCFAQLEEGIEGLIHLSELDWTSKNIHPSKVVEMDQKIKVMILEIDHDKRRISLGLKQTKPNPWTEFANKYGIGDKVDGSIKSITDFGIFVGLEGDIDGLIHLSDISEDEDPKKALEEYKKDQKLQCIVFAVDAERERISLKLSE